MYMKIIIKNGSKFFDAYRVKRKRGLKCIKGVSKRKIKIKKRN